MHQKLRFTLRGVGRMLAQSTPDTLQVRRYIVRVFLEDGQPLLGEKFELLKGFRDFRVAGLGNESCVSILGGMKNLLQKVHRGRFLWTLQSPGLSSQSCAWKLVCMVETMIFSIFCFWACVLNESCC